MSRKATTSSSARPAAAASARGRRIPPAPPARARQMPRRSQRGSAQAGDEAVDAFLRTTDRALGAYLAAVERDLGDDAVAARHLPRRAIVLNLDEGYQAHAVRHLDHALADLLRPRLGAVILAPLEHHLDLLAPVRCLADLGGPFHREDALRSVTAQPQRPTLLAEPLVGGVEEGVEQRVTLARLGAAWARGGSVPLPVRALAGLCAVGRQPVLVVRRGGGGARPRVACGRG